MFCALVLFFAFLPHLLLGLCARGAVGPCGAYFSELMISNAIKPVQSKGHFMFEEVQIFHQDELKTFLSFFSLTHQKHRDAF